ncbi:hypothetical protein DFH07DRAFT_935307 [Mycena maculata]|uniref:Uncharacterized protein n=1 Tax=Mycena maculata TaxID=230809 RepID=A0AAD7P1J9_9AGAR|nr:hypothetical protein DFH07DRAFT_935307 [Mycena maculata]
MPAEFLMEELSDVDSLEECLEGKIRHGPQGRKYLCSLLVFGSVLKRGGDEALYSVPSSSLDQQQGCTAQYGEEKGPIELDALSSVSMSSSSFDLNQNEAVDDGADVAVFRGPTMKRPCMPVWLVPAQTLMTGLPNWDVSRGCVRDYWHPKSTPVSFLRPGNRYVHASTATLPRHATAKIWCPNWEAAYAPKVTRPYGSVKNLPKIDELSEFIENSYEIQFPREQNIPKSFLTFRYE